jgi:chromosomal replication initiation ATPase DnaA
MKDRPGCISIADVQHAVARAFCLSANEMLSRKRRHRLACARQVAGTAAPGGLLSAHRNGFRA